MNKESKVFKINILGKNNIILLDMQYYLNTYQDICFRIMKFQHDNKKIIQYFLPTINTSENLVTINISIGYNTSENYVELDNEISSLIKYDVCVLQDNLSATLQIIYQEKNIGEGMAGNLLNCYNKTKDENVEYRNL